MDIFSRMVFKWGEVDDSLLYRSRMDLLKTHKEGLKMKTQGYQWMKANKLNTADRIVKVDPKGKYTVSESSEFNLGKVDAIWVVASSENPFPDTSLNPISHGIFCCGRLHPPLLKIHFGVSEPNSFLHSHLYIYRQLKSKRTSF